MARTMKTPLTKAEYSKLSKASKMMLKKSCSCVPTRKKRKKRMY